jgi:hypothetical protein
MKEGLLTKIKEQNVKYADEMREVKKLLFFLGMKMDQ